MHHDKIIAVIGAGHLGSALISGLIKSGHPSSSIVVSNSNLTSSKRLAARMNILAAQSNTNAVDQADIVILAVKPQLLKVVCQEIAEIVQKKRPLIISMVGVIHTDAIAYWLNSNNLGLVRTMTNTPIEFCRGLTAMYANAYINQSQMQLSTSLFNAVGSSFWVNNELLIDKLTAPIGCSPAYVFLFMEAFQQAAENRGIPKDLAALIALKIVYGSAELANRSAHSVTELREAVTTPNGITSYSLKGSENTFFDSLKSAFQRAEERIEQIKDTSLQAKL